MQKLFFYAAFVTLALNAQSQSTADVLKQQAGQGVRDGANVATQKAANKLTDKVLSKIFDKKKKTTNTPQNNNSELGIQQNNASKNMLTMQSNAVKNGEGENASLKVYSKFDFVPGDKILTYDDFSKDAVGDFPATWNTNSTGEIVNASSKEGRWLMFAKQGKFIPEYIKSLPDNFTFEYDLLSNDKFSFYSPAFSVYFLTGKNGKNVFDNSFIIGEKRSGVKVSLHPSGGLYNS